MSNPLSTKSNDIYLSVNDNLILELSVKSGSYISYAIYWGDNHKDEFDLTQKETPEARKAIHMYDNIGNFTLKAKVSNNNFLLWKNFTVFVVNCSLPAITLSAGRSQGEAIEISSRTKYTIRASYKFTSSVCNESVMPHLTGKWKVHNNLSGNFIEGQDAEMSNLVFLFNKDVKYKSGMYFVSLIIKWSQDGMINVTMSYTCYIIVFTSPLVAVISEGIEREIAFERDFAGNRTYYDFFVKGNESYDPDERQNADVFLKFHWLKLYFLTKKLCFKYRRTFHYKQGRLNNLLSK